MAHGAGRRAAAARAGWAVRDCADLAHPFAPLERSAEHLAVAAATTYNMMECIIQLYSINTKNLLGMATSASLRTPRSVRPVPGAT